MSQAKRTKKTNTRQHIKNQNEFHQGDRVEIVYYTDPLCCWSWAFEPQWRRLRYEFGSKIRWRYCMGGLIAEWNSYQDPINSVERPIQMGPVWMEAQHASGMPIKDRVWVSDPPNSSYPACIAVKCAELQSVEAGERYLRYLRESVMLEGRNIAKQEVLLQAAGRLSVEAPQVFDAIRFNRDLYSERGRDAFKKDLEKARYHNICRFPTLTLQKPQGRGVIITGYRPYHVLLEAVEKVSPELKPDPKARDAATYAKYWNHITERELTEAIQ